MRSHTRAAWRLLKTFRRPSQPFYRCVCPSPIAASTNKFAVSHEHNLVKSLPLTCPGCGALSQTNDPQAPGFYDSKKAAKKQRSLTAKAEEDQVFRSAVEKGLIPAAPSPESTVDTPTICARCHALRYQSSGESIAHPSIGSIRAMLKKSPHKVNHIYQIIDAADAPASIIPNLNRALALPRLRSKNRRSKEHRRVANVSFIITRSDLLASKKEKVDELFPYFRELIRGALSKASKNARLGNVWLASSHRGWWTREIKEDIWKRGGAAWMVGKVNVGKSALFSNIFPKGRGEHKEHVYKSPSKSLHDAETDGLLPPARPETAYPEMPLVSSLPGTTALPIRIPYGSGRGEVIDLPGIQRTDIEKWIAPEFHKNLIMKSRVTPEQFVIHPGQSLILGGLIRITPSLQPNEVMLAHPFVPPSFTPHVTSTHKAIALQTGIHSSLSKSLEGQAWKGNIPTIATASARENILSAGSFHLEHDSTRKLTGPLTSPSAGKQKPSNLPFIVYSSDIVIESIGWVELSSQVRKSANLVPEVEVFSPGGGYITLRPPLHASTLTPTH
ncbi:hypothetical protein K470DRAFT_257442 [Piedraia hortae CBS 480.64]|uniref:G domain-containing protein n=1 Tax=Piedraia hortae CBS 480.64 TaxID=1314780 RepID=A0A6A7C0A5_9PEZI|nr:hypothetical protein K470DRAFT_257442 [Piedraia hortae CBS 480.64]